LRHSWRVSLAVLLVLRQVRSGRRLLLRRLDYSFLVVVVVRVCLLLRHSLAAHQQPRSLHSFQPLLVALLAPLALLAVSAARVST
jgi:hypothetical protein